jgi:N6-adenosine-specific RNA methylase IME4
MSVQSQFITLRPAGGFGMIMADPPWPTEMRSEAGYAKSPEAHYKTMPLAEIAALPVEMLAAPDCLLWLWARNPQLPEAIDVLRAWGFAFKTAGTWLKRSTHGKVSFGTGYILRSANEPFLIGTRGKPRVASRKVRSAVITHDSRFDIAGDTWPISTITIEGPVNGHSVKPDAGYAAAVELMPDTQRLELFSRTDRAGWSVWGDEAGKFGVAP